MKKSIFASIIASFIIFSCQSKGVQQEQKNTDSSKEITEAVKKEHNSMNSLDWAGKYEGTLPCADCEGIKYIVELKKDGTPKKSGATRRAWQSNDIKNKS